MTAHIADEEFLSPRDLSVSRVPINGVMVIGSCLGSVLPGIIRDHFKVENAGYCLFHYGTKLPTLPDRFTETYNYQILQFAIRTVIPDGWYFPLDGSNVAAYETLFQNACRRIDTMLDDALVWSAATGVPSFVLNFLVPQKNSMGSFFDRYDLRNMVHFVEQLNVHLHGAIRKKNDCHFVDQDAICAAIGRRRVQDDSVNQYNHGAGLYDHVNEFDEARLDGFRNCSHFYDVRTLPFTTAIVAETIAMYTTLRQHDQIKLVAVDLDDTLWRGVAAERGDEIIDYRHVEGWPLGIIEALGYVRRRGVLLALISKNDEETVRRLWATCYESLLPLTHFSTLKINWRSKPENMHELLTSTNLLARNVLYIDDNPIERDAIKRAFPKIRVLGKDPVIWRRLLLWAPEMQVAQITAESANRSEMVRAQIEREASRGYFSQEEFLFGLSLRLEFETISSRDSPGFARAYELVNKSNQFNTTGKRWTSAEFMELFDAGGFLVTASAQDRFTNYGRIAVAVLSGERILQFVMSCRVVGMEVEIASVRHAVNLTLEAGYNVAHADMVETSLNLLARDLFARCGFHREGDQYSLTLVTPIEYPKHIQVLKQPEAQSRAAELAGMSA